MTLDPFVANQIVILRAEFAKVTAAHDAHPERLTAPWRNLLDLVRRRLASGSVYEVEPDLQRLSRMLGLIPAIQNEPATLERLRGRTAPAVREYLPGCEPPGSTTAAKPSPAPMAEIVSPANAGEDGEGIL